LSIHSPPSDSDINLVHSEPIDSSLSSALSFRPPPMLLHEAAATANLRATSDAIAQHPDHINLLDEHYRSVLFCAIVGYE
jgi:hypothetical protein